MSKKDNPVINIVALFLVIGGTIILCEQVFFPLLNYIISCINDVIMWTRS